MTEELYSKVTRRMWIDEVFCGWSKPQPNAQSLWQYLLTGLHNGRIPGLFRLSVATMADDLGWDGEATQVCFGEILRSNRAKYDSVTKLVWLPGALHHNKPTSANHVTGWAADWKLLPSCPLLREAAACFRASLAEMAASYAAAFDGFATDRPSSRAGASVVADGSGKSSPTDPGSRSGRDRETVGDGFADPSGTQEQDQDQEQKQDPVCESDLVPDTKRARADVSPTPPAERLDLSRLPQNLAVTREHIAELLRGYPLLTKLVRRRYVEHLYVTATAHSLRLAHAREAIDSWHATRALSCQHQPDMAIVEDIGRYLAKAKSQRGGRAAHVTSDVVAELAELVTEYGKRWKRVYRRDRVPDKGDEGVCGELLTAAQAEAQGLSPRDIVLSWFDQHLANQDRFLTDQQHPLSRLPRMLSQYEVKRQKPRAPDAPKPTVPDLGPRVESPETRAAREECERMLGIQHQRRHPAKAPVSSPQTDGSAHGSPRAQEGAFPGRQRASADPRSGTYERGPFAPEPEAGPDPPTANVIDLQARRRGGGG